jgi:ABC-2 type transport system ATP-binding protein
MNNQNILVVEKLNKTIKKEKILSNVSFKIPRGVVCAFIGHNGAGKTTTIKSIMNLYRYDSGTIEIDGMNAKKINSHNHIGYVPEKENFPKIKAKKFLQMMACLYDIPKKTIENRIKH